MCKLRDVRTVSTGLAFSSKPETIQHGAHTGYATACVLKVFSHGVVGAEGSCCPGAFLRSKTKCGGTELRC
jgi:hypothetical protein